MRSKWRVFALGSRTYYWSSLFFPRSVRSEVATLYAFVRVADDFVDQTPQDVDGFEAFYADYTRALKAPVGIPIIDDFVSLLRKRSFEESWVEAFFSAMRSDLGEVDFVDVDSLLEYVYGSAEVVGLMMARIMQLPAEADEAACLLGRSMQMINFVRDVQEDNLLGRTYLPASWRGSLTDLTESSARESPDAFVNCVSVALDTYVDWYEQARAGFSFIPFRCLVPIRTAADMYLWTAQRIRKDPFVVFNKKVKPSKLRVLVAGIKNTFLRV